MDSTLFKKIQNPIYTRVPCTKISHCERVCQVLIRDYIIEVLWDYTKKCVLIQDSTNWYYLTHNLISDLTIRQVIIGLGFNYMETEWSYNGEDVLDILAHHAPLSTIRILTLDDVDICKKI